MIRRASDQSGACDIVYVRSAIEVPMIDDVLFVPIAVSVAECGNTSRSAGS